MLKLHAFNFLTLQAMTLIISSINSGSNGNCYYVGTQNEAVLVDAGISCKETEIRFARLGLSLKKVKAIFISHEHIDHIKGVEVLSKKYQLPVYISKATLLNSKLNLSESLIQEFESESVISIGTLRISAFTKQHDAADPYSFTIESNGVRVGVITDIGHACRNVVRHFSKCHAAFLEANYDEDMLEKGHYPIHLKKRISSLRGHLSNRQALELFNKHKAPYLSHLLLAHLSHENNNIELLHNLFKKYAGKTQISIATRQEESPLYYISAGVGAIKGIKSNAVQTMQLSLF